MHRLKGRTAIPAGRQIGEDQEADVVPIVPGDHDVLGDRRQGGQGPQAQRADVDPRPRHELEVFGDPPIEDESAFGLILIEESDGIADREKALLIEASRGEIGSAPVAGGDQRAAHPHLEFRAVRQELELTAGHRKSNDARASPRRSDNRSREVRFRSSPSRRRARPARQSRPVTAPSAPPTDAWEARRPRRK